jgi:hypothetical protein
MAATLCRADHPPFFTAYAIFSLSGFELDGFGER